MTNAPCSAAFDRPSLFARGVDRLRAVRARPLFGGLAIALALVVGGTAAAEANTRIVTLQQTTTGRFADAHETADMDYQLVTRPAQNNTTQQWRVTSIGNNVYTVQQASNGRYMDAYEEDADGWRAVTRDAQNNDSQKWFFVEVAPDTYTIQQVSTGRYLDAWEDEAHDYDMVVWTPNNGTQWKMTVLQTLPNIPILPIGPIQVQPINPPPPPPPVVHSSGNLQVLTGQRGDLDDGQGGGNDGDVQLMIQNLFDLVVAPVNGASFSFTNGAERDYAGCSTASWSNSPIEFTSLSVGDYVCFKTNENRIGEFRVTDLGGIIRALSLSYTTWQ